VEIYALQKNGKYKMTPTTKTLTASAATLFALALLTITAPTAQAEEYCITGGAQVAHGCGYPSLETCRAASAGIGGSCTAAATPSAPREALAYQPKHRSSRNVAPTPNATTGN
jgi:hypothetical protein